MRMRTTLLSAAITALLPGAALADKLSFELFGRYDTGLAVVGENTSGETAALRGNRLFVTNATDVSLDIVDVSKPGSPNLIKRVPLSMYGSSVTSVDVSSRNLVAVAVVGFTKTDPGTVVFLSRQGDVMRTATVGALPDMVTFTPDGGRLLVANEGEPDCYGAGCVDPEGSVSIVDVLPLKHQLPVKTVRFTDVVIPDGVRIFGPNATPAQDLEPEYISVSKDGETAWVTLQENNAIAEIDLDKAKVKAIRPLGYKDFNAAATTETTVLKHPPSIGVAGGKTLFLGGFSGLFYEGRTKSGKLKFVTHTDRGPNGEPTGVRRPFLLPDFTPEIVRMQLNPRNGKLRITQRIPLRGPDGALLSGLPNTAIPGNGNTPYNDEIPVDLFDNVLPLDPLGGDFEGIVVDAQGHFWMCDEYRPAIYRFDANGVMVERFVPAGTAAAAGAAPGTFGIEALPAVLAQRRQNRGFEGMALQNGKLYAFVQSPARNPASLSNGTLNGLQNVRVVEFDPVTYATRQFLYVMDNPLPMGADDTRADKIGDVAALPGGGLLVVERDDDAIDSDDPATITKKVYATSLTGATALTPDLDILYNINGVTKSLDQMSTAELATVGVAPLAKVLHVDLAAAGYDKVEKVEGLAVIDADTIAVINDNDFGVAGISIDTATGTFEYLPDYTPEPIVLGIVDTPGLDASDRDNVINIRKWPVYGMYQPDAMANFRVGHKTYLVTANEGDARDYDGFSEESRARAIRNQYPALPELADDRQLGRLTVTTAVPGGDLSRPYVFGARSFSIWNAATGALVWDSGSELEARTASALPGFFNADNEEDNFDNRSDNKGPEPEGVAVGEVDGRTYAFVGLERIGGVMVYDVSDPRAPEFVEYLTTRSFGGETLGPDAGPEVLRFVDRHASPTGKPMLVVAHEITGTVTMWSLKGGKGKHHDRDDDWHDRWDDDERD